MAHLRAGDKSADQPHIVVQRLREALSSTMHSTANAVQLPPDRHHHASSITAPSNKRRYAPHVIGFLVVTICPPIKRKAMFIEDGEREDGHHCRPVRAAVKLASPQNALAGSSLPPRTNKRGRPAPGSPSLPGIAHRTYAIRQIGRIRRVVSVRLFDHDQEAMHLQPPCSDQGWA